MKKSPADTIDLTGFKFERQKSGSYKVKFASDKDEAVEVEISLRILRLLSPYLEKIIKKSRNIANTSSSTVLTQPKYYFYEIESGEKGTALLKVYFAKGEILNLTLAEADLDALQSEFEKL